MSNAENKFHVYMAKFHRDRPLNSSREIPPWLSPIQVGAALTDERVSDTLDCSGINISWKNPNYSELTALYWIWKNCLGQQGWAESGREGYYGLFHYRRWLDIDKKDIQNIRENDVDAVLPLPTVHEPDISEHHARYIQESDWDAALCALKELQPAYYSLYKEIFSQEYLFNYNILVAKAGVLEKYCEWLFPILERTEELSEPKGAERRDRYIGYIGENLLTLYFMYNKDKLNLVCTGRIMLT